MLRGVETAASENVTQAIQSINARARPETFQGELDAVALDDTAIAQRGSRQTHTQPDLLGTDLRPVRYGGQRSSDVGRELHDMAAPPRPVANRTGNV